MPKLSKCSDVQLLAELLRRRGYHRGPASTSYSDSIQETTIGIGKDNTATIRLHDDDIEALEQETGRLIYPSGNSCRFIPPNG